MIFFMTPLLAHKVNDVIAENDEHQKHALHVLIGRMLVPIPGCPDVSHIRAGGDIQSGHIEIGRGEEPPHNRKDRKEREANPQRPLLIMGQLLGVIKA